MRQAFLAYLLLCFDATTVLASQITDDFPLRLIEAAAQDMLSQDYVVATTHNPAAPYSVRVSQKYKSLAELMSAHPDCCNTYGRSLQEITDACSGYFSRKSFASNVLIEFDVDDTYKGVPMFVNIDVSVRCDGSVINPAED